LLQKSICDRYSDFCSIASSIHWMIFFDDFFQFFKSAARAI